MVILTFFKSISTAMFIILIFNKKYSEVNAILLLITINPNKNN